jgi:hypothetical protein
MFLMVWTETAIVGATFFDLRAVRKWYRSRFVELFRIPLTTGFWIGTAVLLIVRMLPRLRGHSLDWFKKGLNPDR